VLFFSFESHRIQWKVECWLLTGAVTSESQENRVTLCYILLFLILQDIMDDLVLAADGFTYEYIKRKSGNIVLFFSFLFTGYNARSCAGC